MDSLFLLQFACFIFMLINAFIVALSHLHVRWENKRYERSRWMIVVAPVSYTHLGSFLGEDCRPRIETADVLTLQFLRAQVLEEQIQLRDVYKRQPL